jgi:hypothetical protein
MAITTYAQLKTAVTSWMDITSTDLTNQIDDLIMVGEKRLFREVRTRDMETALSSAIASGVVALPASYVGLKFAYIDGTPVQRLERRPAEWIYEAYPTRSSTGKPKFIGRDGTNFIFGPYADSAYTVKGIYYARLAAVATSANSLFVANPDLYLFGRDNRIPIWEAKYAKIRDAVNGEDKQEDASGGALQMRVA